MRDLMAELNALNLRLATEIDHRRQAQDALRRSNERLSFADTVIHDVNNLLLVIYFSSVELLTGLPNDDPKRPALAIIDEARKQIAELTRQFRNSKPAVSYKSHAVDLNELVVQTGQLIRRVVKSDTILSITTAATPAMIPVDYGQVERILLHLFLNALSSIPDGGWITLEISLDDISRTDQIPEERQGLTRCVRLCISNTGSLSGDLKFDEPGLEDASRLPTSEAADGIPLVERLVSQCGGWMEVNTSIETGTRIEIRFPSAVKEAMVPSSFASPRQPDSRHGTILLVDDEPLLRKFVKSTLESHRFTVVEAGDGFTAIATAIEHPDSIDLLILDLKLPDMSGYDVVEKLRTLFPNLPVIFMSGGSYDEPAVQNFSRDTVSFLQKPFQTSDLLLKVWETLDSPIRAS